MILNADNDFNENKDKTKKIDFVSGVAPTGEISNKIISYFQNLYELFAYPKPNLIDKDFFCGH